MSQKTPEQYKESLKKLRPNVHKFGEPIRDVTTHPATRNCIEGHSQLFAAALNPEYGHIFSTTSHLTNEPVSRYLSIIQSVEDMIAVCKMKRAAFNLTGTCTGARCVGHNAFNSMWVTTYEMDKALRTDYHQRLKEWLLHAQANDICVAGALTDPRVTGA